MNSPIKIKPLHLPGQSLDEKFNTFVGENIMSFAALIVIAFYFIVYEWGRFYWKTDPQPIAVTITGIFVILYSFYRIKRNLITARQIKQGREGERAVGQMLEELRSSGCIIFHDIPAEGFNIDHVIVSPRGIFTVETKTWSKQNSQEVIKFDGEQLIINGQIPHKDAITQSISEAKWLRNILKESTGKDFAVWPALVFPGWFIDPGSTKKAKEKGVWLLNPKVLSSFLANESVTINDEDLNLVRFHLSRYIRTSK